jgi:Nif-specific regulatory protein
MNPRFVVLSGPLEGQTFPLGEVAAGRPFRIGRGPENDLQIPSVEVSRSHCEVHRDDEGRFTVLDLDSRHGIFLNSRPVGKGALAHSDLLSVGTSVLLFLLDDVSKDESHQDRGQGSFLGGSTAILRPTNLSLLDPARTKTALPAQARIARDLQTLLRASNRLQGPLELEELARRLVEAAAEVAPTARLALRLREAGDPEANVFAAHGEAPAPLSEPLLAQVLVERTGLLATGEGAVLVAPVPGPDGEICAFLHGDAPRADAFDEEHLELLTTLAALAAPAFHNALHLRALQRENQRLRAQQLDHDLVGESAPMQRLLELIARVSRAETTVLIRGESGTGKELVAQAIHRSSDRAEGPFVALNCATLSETLMESELFGHEKGAFTGAVARTVGKFEVAHRGTLFLDEVGEIPVGLQAKLLRVLQERQFTRLGGTRPITTDVRVVAATNRDLETAIREGTFREDLYYRLKVITLETPPLRARRDDIPLLARHFLALHGKRLGRQGITLSPAARRCLMAYPWPGNVRELGNAIERALVLGETDTVQPEDLPAEIVEGTAELPGTFQEALVETKRRLILEAWENAGGDYGGTADLLGVHVNSLHRMIRRLGLKERLDS